MNNRNDIKSYFEFDDYKKEVIIKRYDTPTPWMNYLSNGTFHTMMSQAGGGLAFYRSPQIWRINRYRFYHLPTDRSGMYFYIRDKKTGEYWSPTSEPVINKPDKWKAAHGMGYTRFEATKLGVSARLKYFVGPNENSLIWNLTLENEGKEEKEIDLFSFVEFGMMEYLREVSWVCYMKHQMSIYFNDNVNALIFKYGVETQPKPEETPLVYLASDYPLKGFDGDRDEFIGTYRSESNPFVLENGDCTGSTLFGGDPCGALQMEVNLKPGEKKTINVFLGTGLTEEDIDKTLQNCRKNSFVEDSFVDLQKNWEKYLSGFSCNLPDADAQRIINIWNPYQAQRNFLFSRNISFYATGTFRGVGFRDTSQDVLAQTPLILEEAKDKIRLLLKEQYKDGHVNHYFFPAEGWDPVTSVHSDDHLWPILAVWNAVVEEGKRDFLNEEIPYYDEGSATVYQHLKTAVDFTMNNIGERGLPLMLRSDWNDQMFKVCRQGKGESFWTSMLLGVTLPKLKELALLLDKNDDADYFETIYNAQKELVNTIGWDGEWYRRAIMDSGLYLGTKENPEAKIWLNAQSWSILSGYASEERGRQAMDVVQKYLDSDLGIKLIHPSITTFPDPKDPLTNYNKGTGENAAVFCHANTWAIIAECMLGRGDLAWKYYRQLIPRVAMEKAGPWRYKAEPYVYVSNLFGPESDKFGLANVSWLSGTASWMYVVATQYILGVRPTWDGLEIDPCLPSDWTELSVTRIFRGCQVDINIRKEKGICKGVRKIVVDGRNITGNVIPENLFLDKQVSILVIM
ncbi:MAG: GH36-type glycosyl hydrolase domain-containing protein [Bacteroidota bacterium]